MPCKVTEMKSQNEKPSPLEDAGLLSVITYGWLNGLIWKGYKNGLDMIDLWNVRRKDNSRISTERFLAAWTVELQKSDPSLRRALFKAFGKSYVVAAICKFIIDAANMVEPWLLRIFIGSLGHMTTRFGILLSLVFFLNSLVQVVCKQMYFTKVQLVGIQVKSALTVVLYKKSLDFSEHSKAMYPAGRLISILGSDLERLEYAANEGHMVWSAPVYIAVALVLLWELVGVNVLAAMPIMLFLLPFFGFSASLQKRFQKKQMEAKDTRLRLVSAALSSMRNIKLQNLQSVFLKKIESARSQELGSLRLATIVVAVNNAILTLTPFFISIAVFASLAIWSRTVLVTALVFPTLTLLTNVQYPLTRLPGVVTALSRASLAADRVQALLLAEEIAPEHFRDDDLDYDGQRSIVITNALFSRSRDDSRSCLQVDHFSVNRGDIVCIVGSVGSGKSTFLQALLGDLNEQQGNVFVGGSLAYFPQQSWLLSITIRENITFGAPWNEKLYRQVLYACALFEDLQTLPYGDDTVISDGAITISGGQKARIMLARAIYSQADSYLLDDCLAAVDKRVGLTLLDRLLGPCGILHHKTIIITTNFAPVFPLATNIVVLKEGSIVERGTYNEIIDRGGFAASILGSLDDGPGALRKQSSDETLAEREGDTASSNDISTVQETDVTIGMATDEPDSPTSEYTMREMSSQLSRDSTDKVSSSRDEQRSEEEYAQGHVKWGVYKEHAMSARPIALVLALIFGLGAQAANIGIPFWLNTWANANDRAHHNEALSWYLIVYIIIGVNATILFLVNNLVFVSYSSIRVSTIFHRKLLRAIFRGTMGFFETIPHGRILNRFSVDMTRVDDMLPDMVCNVFQFLSRAGFLLAVISWNSPVFIIVVVPLSIAYVQIHRYFVRNSLSLTRFFHVTNSFVLSFLEQSVAGSTVIRAFERQEYMSEQFHNQLDDNLRCRYLIMYMSRWIGLRLEFIGSITILATALVSIFNIGGHALPASVGALMMSSALQITTLLSLAIQRLVVIETNVVSDERILEYTHLEPEGSSQPTHDHCIPTEWPTTGSVEIKTYSARYRPQLPLTLNSISASVLSGERIGIVGRTGAGKSSLIQALFRTVEAHAGSILIDGLDISRIPLHRLRGALAIIPQDPLIFPGSVRENLDPFAAHANNDAELWSALADCGLENLVAAMPAQLDTLLDDTESGRQQQISHGHAQLLALARTLLISHAKIIVMDEATSAMDRGTDLRIQEVLFNGDKLRGKTMLVIAHRLETVMGCDRIMVMQGGEIVEFDRAGELLARKGAFWELSQGKGEG
ncbi:MAG: hypothetical protein Q9220_005871 [cf. Caloplaca sp. 1 TL-2023]